MTSGSGIAGMIIKGCSALAVAARSMISKPLYTLAAMALDSLFFVVIGVVTAIFGDRAVAIMLSMSSLVLQQSAALPQEDIASLLSGPAAWIGLKALCLIALMAVAALVAFSVIAGSGWCIAYVLAGKSMGFLRFIAIFSRTSAVLFPVYLLYEVLAYLHDFYSLAAERMSSLAVWDPSWLVPLIGIVTAYFSGLALSSLSEDSTVSALWAAWRKGIVQIKATLLFCIPLIAVVGAVEAVSRVVPALGMTGQVIGIIILLFMLTLLKISLIQLDDQKVEENSLGGM